MLVDLRFVSYLGIQINAKIIAPTDVLPSEEPMSEGRSSSFLQRKKKDQDDWIVLGTDTVTFTIYLTFYFR